MAKKINNKDDNINKDHKKKGKSAKGTSIKKEKILDVKIDKSKKLEKDINDIEVQCEKEYFYNYEVVVIAIISVILGCVLGSIITLNRNNNKLSNNELNEFVSTYNNIKSNYYKKVDSKKLVNAAIEGMVNYLDDPYSVYMNEEEAKTFNEEIEGNYKGIGATVASTDKKIIVVDVFKDSPSDKAGLKVNDEILKVNGKSISEKKLDDVVKMIKNSKIAKLVVMRGDNKLNININISNVDIPSVSSKIIKKENNKIGVIKISIFAANTYKQFSKELSSLEKNKIDSLVIDVRDNTGGHLDQVTKVLSLFMDKSKVLYQIETKGVKKKYYSTGNKNKKYDIAVLINSSSASASEILTAAMKESYGATIVGVKSYGKGTVQYEYPLSSGSSIKYTAQRWLTPKENSIDGKGINPDVNISLDEDYYKNPSDDKDNQLQEAIKFLVEKQQKQK